MAEREKALLVMDMPESCVKCILCVIIDWPEMVCVGKDKRAIDYAPNKKQDWCPLKPVPEKPDYPPINSESALAGWNACIDKILEGEKKRSKEDIC